MLSILRDYGIPRRGQVFVDASAAVGIIHRKGLGRTRHIYIGLLWIQEAAAAKILEFAKAPGAVNPADLFTKYLKREVCTGHCESLRLKFRTGRADAVLLLKAIFDNDFDEEDPWP